MGLITRIGGILLFVASFFLAWETFKHYLIANQASLQLKTLGNGHGSMYRLCDETGAAIEKLTSVDFDASNPPSDIKNYFYSIENPKQYLVNGDDAVVVEKGPYTLKKFTVNHDATLTTSTLTAAEAPSTNGAVEYDVASAYIVLDQDTPLTTNMKRSSTDLSLEWSGTQQGLPSHPLLEATMPPHLSMSDTITNLSPAFLSAMGALNDEFNLILSLSCTAEQVVNIDSAGTDSGPGGADKAQCTASQMNDFAETDCACCMLHSEYITNLPAQATFRDCNEFLDDSSTAMSTLSLLAHYDGGVAVKEAGEAKYDGSGDAFVQTKYEQTTIYTPLVQSHTVNDITFGYPSATIGKLVSSALLSTAEKTYYDANDSTRGDAVDVATLMLTGEMDDALPFRLGNAAAYTKKVAAVCYSSCEAVDVGNSLYDSPLGWTCSGNAPGRYETDEPDEIALGGIDCMPYSSTYATVMQCSAIDTHLSTSPGDPEYQACVCADGSSDWAAEGCCLAGGMLDGEDLTGNGCLYEVDGILGSTNYAGTNDSEDRVNIGAAIQSYIARERSSTFSRFMCPASGSGLPEHQLFNRFETIEGQSSYDMYYATGRPRIQQDDKMTTSASDVYSLSASTGSDITYFPPKGMSLETDHNVISSGTARLVPHPVYVTAGKVAVDFMNDKDTGYAVQRAKTCGTNECLVAARMKSVDSSFARSDATDAMGRGMPFDGLQPIGHGDGPSDSGRPVYFHQPLYLNGDAELLSQQNNTHVDSATVSGNGIQIYRPVTSESSDPGAFVVGDANPNYALVQPSSWASDDGNLRSYFDIEPATGIVARSRMRFGKSYSLWECDPESNSHCQRAQSIGDVDGGDCYQSTGLAHACSSSNVMTPKVIGGKIMPHHWHEEFTTGASKEEVDDLVKFVGDRTRAVLWYRVWWFTSFCIFLVAFMALFQTGCFEQRDMPAVVVQQKGEKEPKSLD